MKEGQDDRAVDALMSIEKTRILQESRCFDAKNINPAECVPIMSKILLILNQGEELTENESTDLFFRVTKLFQCQDNSLRRLLYLLLKELNPKETEVFIITSSLMKDISGGSNDFHRANALRVLGKIIDPAMLSQVERYIKTSIVDKNDSVSTAAMLTGIRLAKTAPEMVRRWITEVQEKLSSGYYNTHYHGLILFHEMKRNDPVGLTKFLISMIKANLKSPVANCQLIRYIKEALMSESLETSVENQLAEYLESCLHKSQDMVVFEAAKAICEWPNAPTKSLTAAFTVIQLFLSSTKSIVKYAAIKILNRLAGSRASFVATNLKDIDNLTYDPNKSIATLAISTRLKVSSENNVEHFLSNITYSMYDSKDDFNQIDIINSIKNLIPRMPNKYRALLTCLSKSLRNTKSFTLHNAIIEAILGIMTEAPDSKELGLSTLAEYIEECEFDMIQCKVLHLLGEFGPKSAKPSKLIRYIYNRLILEKPVVRAAAVTCLAKFSKVPALAESVAVLLSQCQNDLDDEVRERAEFYSKYILNGFLPEANLPFSIIQLEKAVQKCKAKGIRFSPEEVNEIENIEEEFKSPLLPEKPAEPEPVGIPEISSLGEARRVSSQIYLTEKTSEFVVVLVKKVYENELVLEFTVKNTLNDIGMKDVWIELHLEKTPLESLLEREDGVSIYPCGSIDREETGSVSIVLKKPRSAVVGVVAANLKFTALEYGGDNIVAQYPDDYQLENVEFTLTDFT